MVDNCRQYVVKYKVLMLGVRDLVKAVAYRDFRSACQQDPKSDSF